MRSMTTQPRRAIGDHCAQRIDSMIRLCRVALALVPTTLVFPNIGAAQDDGWRTIEIETTEVTTPDVALSPDGESLMFTMLGKLFRLPVEGADRARRWRPRCRRSPTPTERVCRGFRERRARWRCSERVHPG